MTLHAPRSGFFITLEGGEGAGKSTQISRLAEALRSAGHEVVTTREPGGSPGAEAIRTLILSGTYGFSAVTEALLFSAARHDHLEKTIRPALARGAIVICDRFYDSTRAYQGASGQADPAIIAALAEIAVGPTKPDLTFILDLSPREGLRRATLRRGKSDADRFEREDVVFHEKLRDGFLCIAREEPQRCVVIDAAADIDAVAHTLQTETLARIKANAA